MSFFFPGPGEELSSFANLSMGVRARAVQVDGELDGFRLLALEDVAVVAEEVRAVEAHGTVEGLVVESDEVQARGPGR